MNNATVRACLQYVVFVCVCVFVCVSARCCSVGPPTPSIMNASRVVLCKTSARVPDRFCFFFHPLQACGKYSSCRRCNSPGGTSVAHKQRDDDAARTGGGCPAIDECALLCMIIVLVEGRLVGVRSAASVAASVA